MDMNTFRGILAYVGKGSAIGMIAGGIMGAVSYKSQTSFDKRVQRLQNTDDVDISSLRRDEVFLQAIMEFQAYSKIDMPRSKRLFKTTVKCCNSIVHLYSQLHAEHVVTPGVLQFRMNRYLRELQEALQAMERTCRRVATDPGLVIDYEHYAGNVYKCADNYIHNACLR